MLRHSPLRALSRSTAFAAQPNQMRPEDDVGCTCYDTKSRAVQLSSMSTTPLLHMDECTDPHCEELEQLRAYENSVNHFTDYDKYEQWCDRHHRGPHRPNVCYLNNGPNDSPLPERCENFYENCEACADEHQDCFDHVVIRDGDCEQCEVECEEQGHEPEDCPHDHPTTRDNCGPTYQLNQAPLPQLGPADGFDANGFMDLMQSVTPCTVDCNKSIPSVVDAMPNQMGVPIFDSDMDHWKTFVQTHHCAPDPCMVGQSAQFHHPQHMDPSFGFTFGCDPSLPGNQYPWQTPNISCKMTANPFANLLAAAGEFSTQSSMPHDLIASYSPPPSESSKTSTSTASAPTNTPTTANPTSTNTTPSSSDRTCEWIMPCGSICGASFSRTEDLKKHIKNSHSTRGTVTCRWNSCTASFASEAALTGHISKKHLTVSDEEGPWKCTFPGCTKSFMYKQVRDDHVSSHNGGNRVHCPICHQWLNSEGSNFRRHMASHGPKNEHMRCRYESLGCKKRFPRLDNLRRHEACCKFGKRAAGVHHHHHRIHVGHGT